MDSYSDQSINLDELIFQLPSFIKTQEDCITKEELAEMNKRVISLLNTLGQNFTSEQIGSFSDLLREIKKLQEQETRKAEREKTKKEECLLQKEQVVAIWKKLKKSSTSEQKKQIKRLLSEINVPMTMISIGYFTNLFINKIVISIKKYKIVLCSIIGAFIVSTACWVRDNIPTTYFESLDALSYLSLFHSHDSLKLDSVCFIDISNYHEVVKTPIDNSIMEGDIVITNREKLLYFLQSIETIKYKYLFIDLFFDKKSKRENTSIYYQIKGMKNVIVSSPPDNIVEDERFSSFSARNSYYIPRFDSGHRRSWLISNRKKQSVPLMIYNSTHPTNPIKAPNNEKWHHINLLGDSLSIPLDWPFRNSPITFIPYIDGLQKPNWGFFDIYEDIDYYLSQIEGRIIIVGDMYSGEDMHVTYAGKVPGPLLTYYQYLSLQEKEKHVVFDWIFLGIYFFIIWIRLTRYKKRQLLKKGKRHFTKSQQSSFRIVKIIWSSKFVVMFRSTIWAFTTSFLGYSFYFGVVSWLLIETCQFAYSTFIPSLMFAILEWMLKSAEEYENKIHQIKTISIDE